MKLSKCCKSRVRFVNCADCEEKGVTCELVICCECGADV